MMGWLPTPFTVGVRRYVEGVEDDRGNPVDSWDDPIDLPVSFIAPGVVDEPVPDMRDSDEVAFTVGLPEHDNMPGVRDLVRIDGTDYPVHGRPKDYSKGPFGFDAGWTFQLKKVNG